MMTNIKKIFGGPSIGLAALLAVWAAPAVFASEAVSAEVPFSFEVGRMTLPPGHYRFEIDREAGVVNIFGTNKGMNALEHIITTLAKPEHTTATDAHIVFDKIGNQSLLSEIWLPGAEGVLVHAASQPHEHHVLHLKR